MKRLTIKEMQDIASAKNGKCISAKYKNNYTPLEWECERRHRWFALPKAIKQGHWCKICFDEGRKFSLEEMMILARKRGGKCLSKTYTDSQTHHIVGMR